VCGVFAPRRLGLIASLAAVAGAAALSASALAAGSSPITYSLKNNDQIFVKGTSIACVIQSSAGTLNLVCVDGSLSAPKGGSFAVGIADKAASLNQISAGGGSQKVVKLSLQPTVAGSKFPVRSGGAKSYTIPSTPSAALLIGGTHIFCVVQKTGVVNVTCGVSSIADKLQFPAGSYVTIISPKVVLLAQKLAHGGVKTVVSRSQP
jgi:hypothetical protein